MHCRDGGTNDWTKKQDKLLPETKQKLSPTPLFVRLWGAYSLAKAHTKNRLSFNGELNLPLSQLRFSAAVAVLPCYLPTFSQAGRVE